MERISFRDIRITGGFWKKRMDLVREKTVYAVYDRFKDTGRFDAFRCDWKEGMPNRPHYFWDSDVAKWMEGAAYLLEQKRDPQLEEIIDETVANIAKNQWEDGYFNIYYTLFKRDSRFTVRGEHELYCAGHLIEAAVAYFKATGKRLFLDCMIKYAEFIEKRFKTDRDAGFTTPGHEEIELALVKLWQCTNNKRWLELSKFFLDERGVRAENEPEWMKPSYNQSHLPVRGQKTAEGHSVRACYLYSAMADVARETDDEELKAACRAIFDDITGKKMYITGGVGSSSGGEAFTVPYDLPNLLAYTESCAAIALAMFAGRMQLLENDARYADTVERIIYNGFLSSISLDGKSFFYENPLEVMPYLHTRDVSISGSSLHLPPMRRSEVFGCSCCPPNIVRFIPSIADYMYTVDESGEEPVVFVQQFMNSATKTVLGSKTVEITQKTRYPEDGKVVITVKGGSVKFAVRVPGWCDAHFVRDLENVEFLGQKDRYMYFKTAEGPGSVTVEFAMEPVLMEADPRSRFDCGKAALMRGPVVYCLEGCDNGEPLRDIRIGDGTFKYRAKGPLEGVPSVTASAVRRRAECFGDSLYAPRQAVQYEKIKAVFIPYYAFANRDECEMTVWVDHD